MVLLERELGTVAHQCSRLADCIGLELTKVGANTVRTPQEFEAFAEGDTTVELYFDSASPRPTVQEQNAGDRLAGEQKLLRILRGVGLDKYASDLRASGLVTDMDLAELTSPNDDRLPVSLPAHIATKLVAHGQRLARIHSARGNRRELTPPGGHGVRVSSSRVSPCTAAGMPNEQLQSSVVP